MYHDIKLFLKAHRFVNVLIINRYNPPTSTVNARNMSGIEYFKERDQESATLSGLNDDFRTHGQRPHGARFAFGTADRVDSGYASEDFKGG